jgi:hypothetical protein
VLRRRFPQQAGHWSSRRLRGPAASRTDTARKDRGMSADDYQPEPAEKQRAVDEAGGPEAAVDAALHERDPAIDVADLRITEAEDAVPVVEGRVGSEKDKEWAIGRARNTLGQEVHDAIEVDEALPTTAPERVVSGFEGDGVLDVTQGAIEPGEADR